MKSCLLLIVVLGPVSAGSQGTAAPPPRTPTKITVQHTTALRYLDVATFGASGDGTTDDTIAIQTAIDALPAYTGTFGHTDFTQSNVTSCVVFPPTTGAYYKISGPISVKKSGTCLLGATGAVTIRNVTSGENVLNVDAGSDSILFGIRVENLTLRGSGSSSRALYLNQVSRSYFRIWTVGHPGTAVYMDSTGTRFSGSPFNTIILDAEANQAPGSVGLFSRGGRSNDFQVRARELEVGVDLQDEIGSVIHNSYIESNDGGTAKTGIRLRRSKTYPVPGSANPRNVIAIRDSYFEGNDNYDVDADSGFHVSAQNIRGGGGFSARGVLEGEWRLDGGGEIEGFWGASNKITSSRGIVTVRNAWGIFGSVSHVQVAGVTLPPPTGGVNSATKSWFDTEPTWTNLGSPNAPALSYDATQKFYGKGSKKAVFPAAASNFRDSRTRMDQTITAVKQDDELAVFVVAKFGTSGKPMSFALRENGGKSATIHDFNFVTDSSDWMVFTLQGRVPPNVTSAALFLSGTSVALGVPLEIWIGGVAITKNAVPVLVNTD